VHLHKPSFGSFIQELPAFYARNYSIFYQHRLFCHKLLTQLHKIAGRLAWAFAGSFRHKIADSVRKRPHEPQAVEAELLCVKPKPGKICRQMARVNWQCGRFRLDETTLSRLVASLPLPHHRLRF